MMEDGEVALNGVAEPSKDSEPTSAKSEREPTRSPGGDPSSPEHKRKRDSKEEGGSSAKRHKEHKHKKHKKHKKERKSDSSPEATHRERAVSGSRSPSPKDTSKTDDRKSNDKQSSKEGDRDSKRTHSDRERRRSNSRENRERRDYGRERSKSHERDRGRERERSRGRRDGSRERRERSRGRDDRGDRGARAPLRERERGRDQDRGRQTRDYKERDPVRDTARNTGRALGRESRREEPRKPRHSEKKKEELVVDAAKEAAKEAAAAEEEAAYQRRIEEQMAAMGSDDESEDEEAAAAKAAEESRRRRQAIVDKHKSDEKAAPAKDKPAENGVAEASGTDAGTDANGSSDDQDGAIGRKQGDVTGGETSEDEDDTKAADVDEAAMLKEDEEQMAKKLGSPQNVKTYDMFGENDGVAAANVTAINRNAGGNALDNDNWDDADGYYKFQMGEKMQDRYEVYEITGKGVFSNVLRARDVNEENREVAIKIIRNNDMMKKCGDKELEILQLIAQEHGADKHNIVQLHEHFWMHGHLCLVFEALAMNLREVIKKFGNKKGINVGAVHKFAKQMFVALKHMKACKIVHADIKPDNILVNDRHNQIKICDFGSASYRSECDITPYLVSRWYRAPEITLCLAYDYGIDMWSIATCLYELYTGKVMFSGNTNNDMLRRFMEIKGKFPNKLLKRSFSKCAELGRPVDFSDDFKFLRVVEDKITKAQSIKVINIDEKPEKDLLKLCMPHKIKNPDEAKMVKDLVDLLHHCLALNNEQRFTPEQALKHSFVKTQIH